MGTITTKPKPIKIQHDLFEFYPDEITFTEDEFIGLSLETAKNLKFEKDLKYIQS